MQYSQRMLQGWIQSLSKAPKWAIVLNSKCRWLRYPTKCSNSKVSSDLSSLRDIWVCKPSLMIVKKSSAPGIQLTSFLKCMTLWILFMMKLMNSTLITKTVKRRKLHNPVPCLHKHPVVPAEAPASPTKPSNSTATCINSNPSSITWRT